MRKPQHEGEPRPGCAGRAAVRIAGPDGNRLVLPRRRWRSKPGRAYAEPAVVANRSAAPEPGALRPLRPPQPGRAAALPAHWRRFAVSRFAITACAVGPVKGGSPASIS